MLTSDELDELLDRAAESTVLDFKARLDWSVNLRKWAALKEIACLANTRGGHIIYGVEEVNGVYRFTGLAADDAWPDVTTVNEQLRQNFAPPVSCEVEAITCRHGTFGVVAAPEFPDIPHICTTTRAEQGRPPTLRRGALYLRSTATNCEEPSAHEWRLLFDRGLTKRGLSIAAMLRHDRPQQDAQNELQAGHPFNRPILDRFASLRAADMYPIRPIDPRTLADLEERLRRSLVRHPIAHAFFPRYADLVAQDPQSVERTPRGVVYELTEGEGDNIRGASVSEVRRDGSVSVRESLWEDGEFPGEQRFDLVTFMRFGYASLWFAERFYSGLGVGSIAWSLGIVGPQGRQLFRQDHWHERVFEPLPYFATSDEDLWVSRVLEPNALNSINTRVAVLDEALDELLQYFGFAVESADYFKARLTAVNLWEPTWP